MNEDTEVSPKINLVFDNTVDKDKSNMENNLEDIYLIDESICDTTQDTEKSQVVHIHDRMIDKDTETYTSSIIHSLTAHSSAQLVSSNHPGNPIGITQGRQYIDGSQKTVC